VTSARRVGARGRPPAVRVAAEHRLRDGVEVGAETLQHVGAAVDEGFEQRREHAGAAVNRFVRVHLRGDRIEGRQGGEAHGDEKIGRQDEACRRQERIGGVALRDQRGAQRDDAMIGDQPARRFDLAQRRDRGDAQAGAALGERAFVLGRVEQVDPEHALRQCLAAAVADRAVRVAIDGEHLKTSPPQTPAP
jgi:hypothetical protein